MSQIPHFEFLSSSPLLRKHSWCVALEMHLSVAFTSSKQDQDAITNTFDSRSTTQNFVVHPHHLNHTQINKPSLCHGRPSRCPVLNVHGKQARRDAPLAKNSDTVRKIAKSSTDRFTSSSARLPKTSRMTSAPAGRTCAPSSFRPTSISHVSSGSP